MNQALHPSVTIKANRLDVAQIVAPRSIAVLGASDDLKKFGGRIIHYLMRNGYRGRVVPVNPRRSEVAGLTAKAAYCLHSHPPAALCSGHP